MASFWRPRRLAVSSPRARTTATAIYSHPFLPFYLTGSQEGKTFLWQYGSEVPLATFSPVKTVFDLLRFEHRNVLRND